MRPVVHIEIPSSDNAAAKQFYSALLGWQVEEIPMGGGSTYTLFNTGVDMAVALAPVSEADNIAPGDVILYFQSDDLDADIARASELGGEVLLARQDIPGFGSLGIFKDPTGNRVAFWQNANPGQG
ncbi:MAG: VOC family protein [Chloroflexi bacterium]|nr:VOC family protein [Chloroflexota bacterium]MCY4248515.1 VOC family protein [Chloroflexota bacterium]